MSPESRRLTLRLALACLPALGAFVWLRSGGTPPAELLEKLGPVSPVALGLAIAALPLFGFPLAPLYALAGLRFGWATGYPLCLLGVTANLLAAYPVYGKLLRGPVGALLLRRGWNPEKWRGEDRWRITLLVAAVPALPFWAQNAVLAAIGTPFRIYLAGCLLVQAVFAAAGVALGTAGRTALSSETGTLTLLASIPLSLFLLHRIRVRMRRRRVDTTA